MKTGTHYWPCKICGHDHKSQIHKFEWLGVYGVECRKCEFVTVKGADSEEQARRLWNKLNRPPKD